MRLRGRLETVELIVPLGYTGGQINFPDIPELRSDMDKDAVIYSVSTYTADSVPSSFNGNPVATQAQLSNGFLTLYVTGSNNVFNVPLRKFLNIETAGATPNYFNAREYFEFAPQRVDWTKSYVRFATPGLSTTPLYVYLFDFAYEWLPAGSYNNYLTQTNNAFAQGQIL